jgi:hypothetical protein
MLLNHFRCGLTGVEDGGGIPLAREQDVMEKGKYFPVRCPYWPGRETSPPMFAL